MLEDQGRQNINPPEHNNKNKNKTEEQMVEEQRKLNENISEHFDAGSTWEKVDMSWISMDTDKGVSTTSKSVEVCGADG